MRKIVVAIGAVVGLVVVNASVLSQETGNESVKKAPLTVLAPLEGTWLAQGKGFSSQLTYEWAFPKVLLRARNELRNDAGAVFGQYEGYYAWDPTNSKIIFWTVSRDGELHRGDAEWREGQLWHQATVAGSKVTGYRSVLGMVESELHYRAKYDPAATEKDVLSSTSLIYRRVQR